jgi:hypothetical protein
MRVDTMLRKEKEGTLWKHSGGGAVAVEQKSGEPPKVMTGAPAVEHLGDLKGSLESRLSALFGDQVELQDFGRTRLAGTVYDRMRDELSKVGADQLSGGMADKKRPSDFDAGQLRLGKKVEMEHTDDPKKSREIAMDHLQEHPQYYTALKKMEARLEKGASSYTTMRTAPVAVVEDPLHGMPATPKRRPGDVPTIDNPATYPVMENSQQNTQTAMPSKVAAAPVPDSGLMAHMKDRRRVRESMREIGDSVTPEHNPNWDKVGMAAMRSEFIKLCSAEDRVQSAYVEFLEKRAQREDLSEMEKEAIMQQLRSLGRGAMQAGRRVGAGARELGGALVGAPVKLNVGDEVVQVAGQGVLPSYRGIGKSLQETGKLMGGAPKGITAQQARAAGIPVPGMAGRVGGEMAEAAGHHMSHSSNIGIGMNPLGKPIGGAIEGLSRGVGKELQRAGGLGVEAGGGGIRGQLARGLQRHAPTIGQAGEILTGAGTATALGHAISPAAHGLAAAAKATGTYGPMKAALGGKLGLNLAKDVAASGLERGVQRGHGALQGLGEALVS